MCGSKGTWLCGSTNKISESHQKNRGWSTYHVEYLESYFSCIKECNLKKKCCHNIKIYKVGQEYSRENDLAYFGENMYNNECAIPNRQEKHELDWDECEKLARCKILH